MSRFFLAQLSQLKGFAKKILPQRLSQYHYRVFFVFLVVLFLALSVRVVHADLDPSTLFSGLVSVIASLMLELATLALEMAIFLLKYFITLASYNDFINVGVVKIGWVMVRDVANMFFVVALLIIAFATILGVEKYEWKKGLVKLIIMAILINFSNLIAQIIIDAAHVFTITFLNAISASAGGNLINMFSMSKITSMLTGGALTPTDTEGLTISIFGAVVLSLVFAVSTMVAIGAYVVIMVLRIVVLWALIILSPLAYLMSAMPSGEGYAKKWWSEFTKHIVVAPVMVFFLWLSFATLGTGQIMSEIQSTSGTIPLVQTDELGTQTGATAEQSVSILEVSSWKRMSNFILAFVFLLLGAKMTQETGAAGSQLAGKVGDYAKKAGMVFSGAAAARWGAKKFVGGAKKLVGEYADIIAGKTGLKKLPFVGSESKSSIRRAAALKRNEDFYKARREGIMATAGGVFGTSKKAIAKQEEKTKGIVDKEKEDHRKLRLDALLKLQTQQKNEFQADMSSRLLAASQKKLRELQASKVPKDAEKAKEREEKIAKLGKEIQEAEKMENPEERLKALSKTADLSDEQTVAMERKALEKNPILAARIQKLQNDDAEATMNGNLDRVIGELNLASLSRQRDESQDAIDAAINAYIEDQMKNIDEFTHDDILAFAAEHKAKQINKIDGDSKITDPEKIKLKSEVKDLDFTEATSKYFTEQARARKTRINDAVDSGKTLGEATSAVDKEIEEERIVSRKKRIEDIVYSSSPGLTDEEAEAKFKEKTRQRVFENYEANTEQVEKKFREDWTKKNREKFEDKYIAEQRETLRETALTLVDIKNAGLPVGTKATQEDKEKWIQEYIDGELYTDGKLKDTVEGEMKVVVAGQIFNSEMQEELEKAVTAKFETRDAALANSGKNIGKVIEEDTRSALVANMADYEKANIMAAEVEKHPEWTKIQAFYATKSAARSVGKYKTEEEKMNLRMSDILRGTEGKTMDEEKNWQRSKIAESMKEFQTLTYDERMTEMKRNVKISKELGEKEAHGALTSQEKKLLESASQRQAGVLASIMDQGEFNAFASEFRDYMVNELGDTSYEELTTDTENIAALTLGALTGASVKEMEGEGLSAVEEKFKKRLKEKVGVFMRTLQHGMDKSAKDGNSQHHHQIIEGVDAIGNRVIGFTNAMASGVGTGLVGKKGRRLGTGESKAGAQKIRDDYDSTMAPNFDINTSKDGRSYVATNAAGEVTDFLHDEAQESVLSVANLSSQAIASMGSTKLRYLAGSKGYGKSIYNRDTRKLELPTSGRIKSTWKKVVTDISYNAEKGASANIRDNALRSFRVLFKNWGVPNADTMSTPALKSLAARSGLI